MTWKKSIIAGFLISASTAVWASSPAAWKELEDSVRKDCNKRYQFEAGKNAAAPASLVDVMGGQNIVSAFLRSSSPRGPKAPLYLCLYSKTEKKIIEFYEVPAFYDDKSWK